MTRLPDWREMAGTGVVFAILLGVPMTLWAWHVRTMRHQPAGTKIFQLTAIADHGVWTQEDVVGWNYWWKKPMRTDTLALNQGDHVILRLRSADVLHSFAIPILHLGPVDIPSGHTVQVEFNADRAGTLTFFCWQVCSHDHQMLQGKFVVQAKQGNAGDADSW